MAVVVVTVFLRRPWHIVVNDESVRISCGESGQVRWSAQMGIDSGVQIDGVYTYRLSDLYTNYRWTMNTLEEDSKK